MFVTRKYLISVIENSLSIPISTILWNIEVLMLLALGISVYIFSLGFTLAIWEQTKQQELYRCLLNNLVQVGYRDR